MGQTFEIPDWVKNNAKLWSGYQISDQDFVSGVEYLVQKEIITIPQNTKYSDSSSSIPSWFRNNAGWWSQGLLSDDEFVKGIQYLVSKGIINIQQINISCIGKELCIHGLVEKIVDGDTIHIGGYTVRLSLTNTPERNEDGYFQATEFTKTLCPVGSIATVDQDDMQPIDVYGRILGKVYCGDKILNSELLYNKHANILTQYCSSEFSGEVWALQYGCGKPLESKQTIKEIPKLQNRENCDASYPDVCIPSYPPDLDCKDVQYRNFKVLLPDPHRFDADKDGIGCESK